MGHENGRRWNAPEKQCGAKKRSGGLCEQAAGWGTSHPGYGACRFHGGATESHQKAAQREQAEEQVVAYGLPIEIDPHTALLDELYRTSGHVAWLQRQVAASPEASLIGKVGADGRDRESGLDHYARGEPSVWLRLYQEERKHLASVAATCIKVGIEERKVEIAKTQGAIFAAVISAIVVDLGHNINAQDVQATVRKHLTIAGEGRLLAA